MHFEGAPLRGLFPCEIGSQSRRVLNETFMPLEPDAGPPGRDCRDEAGISSISPTSYLFEASEELYKMLLLSNRYAKTKII